MRHRKRPLILLFAGVICLITLGCLVYFIPPNTSFSLLQIVPSIPSTIDKYTQFPTILLFYILLSLFLFTTVSYFFKSKIHGVLITAFVIIYLIFRLNHLTNPFFLIILLALFVTLEMVVNNNR